jgi:hypothetical protein
VQARLGQGAALIGTQSYEEAAALYATTAARSRETADWRNALDSYRLASFCCEQHRDYAQAWQLGLQGMEVARAMEPSLLEMTSIA